MKIVGARVIDPATGVDEVRDLRVGDSEGMIEANGLIAAPGFVDLHAHLREPGFEESETIADGAHAALRGGFTTVCCMANTDPALDNAALLEDVKQRALSSGGARVIPIAAITRGRRGTQLTDMVELAAAGAAAFSDDGAPVSDPRLMRHALEYARATDLAIVAHAEDASLAAGGTMHEGDVSALLGLTGIPAAAEETMIARDLRLLRLTGGRLHIAHVSTAGSVELIRRAKADGLTVTCEVTPHHLAMTDAWVAGDRSLAWESPTNGDGATERAPGALPYDTFTKVNPPLRPRGDVEALWEALRDGTIDAIATDHAPHARTLKEVEYDRAAFGISGLETALALLLGAVRAGWIEMSTLIERLTVGPERCLDIEPKTIDPDIVLIDPTLEWEVTPDELSSRGKNTPLIGRRLRGRVVAVFIDGVQRLD